MKIGFLHTHRIMECPLLRPRPREMVMEVASSDSARILAYKRWAAEAARGARALSAHFIAQLARAAHMQRVCIPLSPAKIKRVIKLFSPNIIWLSFQVSIVTKRDVPFLCLRFLDFFVVDIVFFSVPIFCNLLFFSRPD
jgi:hypothetical protein